MTSQSMVVSQEYVAHQVKAVIERREEWLWEHHLALETVMNEEQKDAFLLECKDEYHNDEDQKRRQAADREDGKNVRDGKKQRWSREQQRRAGSTQMWTLLSFSGKWGPSFLATLPKTSQPEADEEQKA